jgi:hypothetical protein
VEGNDELQDSSLESSMLYGRNEMFKPRGGGNFDDASGDFSRHSYNE